MTDTKWGQCQGFWGCPSFWHARIFLGQVRGNSFHVYHLMPLNEKSKSWIVTGVIVSCIINVLSCMHPSLLYIIAEMYKLHKITQSDEWRQEMFPEFSFWHACRYLQPSEQGVPNWRFLAKSSCHYWCSDTPRQVKVLAKESGSGFHQRLFSELSRHILSQEEFVKIALSIN